MKLFVIGGGLSGLTAAFTAKKKGHDVLIFERSGRVGGAILSERRSGYLLEHGPNTVLPKPEILELAHELDLDADIELGSARAPRYVLLQGKLHPVPMSPPALFTSSLLSLRGKIRALKEPFVEPRKQNGSEETLHAFATRRLGTEVADRLVAPFVSGIWAGNAAELSAASAFPMLTQWETEHGGIIKGAVLSKKAANADKTRTAPKGLLTFRDGLGSLIGRLERFLSPKILYHQRIESVKKNAAGTWDLHDGTRTLTADKIVVSCPAHAAAKLIRAMSGETADALDSIPYAPVAVVHLGFKKAQIKSPIPGFGFLAAPAEKSDILGCLWTSNIFPSRAPADSLLCTVFLGGATNAGVLNNSDADVIEKAVEAVRPIMKIEGSPELANLIRYDRAIPQYTLGHAARIATIAAFENQNPGIHFTGNYRGGISVGDVIKSTKNALSRIL